jgi:hypothetical protein
MYAQTSNTTPAGSVFQNFVTKGGWPFQLRHSEAWAAVRAIAAVWFVTLGTVLVTHGYAWGALLYLAAVLSLALASRLAKTSRARGR